MSCAICLAQPTASLSAASKTLNDAGLLTLSTWMMAAMCLGQLPNYVPSDGLVAWYPFNGNVQDESGNGLHASEFAVAFVESRANAGQLH